MEPFLKGDVVFLIGEGNLWPCLVINRRLLQVVVGVEKERDDLQNQVKKRLEAFRCIPTEYLIRRLPFPAYSLEGQWGDEELEIVHDHCLVPYAFTTPPVSVENQRLNRALIQAIYIQTSWSLPDFEIKMERRASLKDSLMDVDLTEPKLENGSIDIKNGQEAKAIEDKIVHIEDPILPEWTLALKIGNPSLAEIYRNGTIQQNMMEPKLIEILMDDDDIGSINLSKELLREGVSHWKNTTGKFIFHQSKVVTKQEEKMEFPKRARYEKVRFGVSILAKGQLLTTFGSAILTLDFMYVGRDGLVFVGLDEDGQIIEVLGKNVDGRFNPVFDRGSSDVWIQCKWDGSKIKVRERRVIL